MPSINSKTIAPNSVLKLATGPAEGKMLPAMFVLLADFQQSDVEAAGGTASATGKDKADLERRTLIEALD
jgi:hypothetical protein